MADQLTAVIDARIAALTDCAVRVRAGHCPFCERQHSPGRDQAPAKRAQAPKPAPAKTATPTAVRPTPAKKTGRVTGDQVCTLVAERKGMTLDEVAAALGMKTNSAYFHLHGLVEAGRLVQGGDKKFRRVIAEA